MAPSDGCVLKEHRFPAQHSQPHSASLAKSWQQPPQPAHAASTSARASPAGGKREQTYGDGRRKVEFANGTTKYVLPDGLTMVQFVNGDMKKQHPCGLVEYYYKEVDTWHSTLPDGIEVRSIQLFLCSDECWASCAWHVPWQMCFPAQGLADCIRIPHCKDQRHDLVHQAAPDSAACIRSVCTQALPPT